MKATRTLIFAATCLLAGSAVAQAGKPPLNLQLPPTNLPVTTSTTAARPATTTSGNPTSAPGVYYGDHGTSPAGAGERVAAHHCDDSTGNPARLHGSASAGVIGGNHVSGNYQAATIDVTKDLGGCEHPTGGIGVSISVSQSRLSGRHW